MKKYLWMSFAAVVIGALRVNLHLIFSELYGYASKGHNDGQKLVLYDLRVAILR